MLYGRPYEREVKTNEPKPFIRANAWVCMTANLTLSAPCRDDSPSHWQFSSDQYSSVSTKTKMFPSELDSPTNTCTRGSVVFRCFQKEFRRNKCHLKRFNLLWQLKVQVTALDRGVTAVCLALRMCKHAAKPSALYATIQYFRADSSTGRSF